MVREFFFESREALLDALTEQCVGRFNAGIAERGEAGFLVSGGSTPEALYRRLSQQELAWANVRVAMVDERWVDVDHPRSNETFVRNSLLQAAAADCLFKGMKTSAPTPQDGLAECEVRHQWLLAGSDVAILGMGPDGHTASYFPHADGLVAALESEAACAAVTARASAVTGEEVQRMTLTLHALQQCKELILLITGDDKLATYQDAKTAGDVADMPVRAVLQQTVVPVSVYWAP